MDFLSENTENQKSIYYSDSRHAAQWNYETTICSQISNEIQESLLRLTDLKKYPVLKNRGHFVTLRMDSLKML